jgi:dTDP-4-dehydrorhamnose 3,5-epimerase
MKFIPTTIDGAYMIETAPKCDDRGSFSRLYCADAMAAILGNKKIVQINHSYTALAGAMRGLHYQQPPHAETKIVRCLHGKVWDVVVDLRKGSPSFLQYFAVELAPDFHNALLVPEGCAHGFQTLAADCELLYLHTEFYNPHAERGLQYDEQQLTIPWPLPVTDLSPRDKAHPPLPMNFEGIAL